MRQHRESYAGGAASGASEVNDAAGVVGSSINIVTAQLDLEVLVATEEMRREFAERYGAGTVRLIGKLEPID